jgi:hypothetical protein
MPIELTIYHPDRLLIGRATGELSITDFVKFALEIRRADIVHYRKIIDVIDAHPAFTEQELRALVLAIREVQIGNRRRGALAFVADPTRGKFAKLFASLDIDGRPASVFRSIHDARRWISDNPSEPG